jgi:Zn-dependent alcohol dehydrogenase
LFQGFGLCGLAEQTLIHENQLAVVLKEMPFAQAALLGCGVVTGAGAVLNTANVSAGDSVVSRRIALREVNDGYAALKDGSLNRVVVTSF